MDHSMFLSLVLYALFVFQDVSSTTTWNMPRPVVGYHSYLDVSPVKYDVPPGLSHMNFSFNAARNDKNCGDKVIHVLIQHNGLPLVKETNLSFPDNFVVEKGPTVKFSVKLEQPVVFSIVRPPPGAWYVIVYFEGEDMKIQQKGLEPGLTCVYSYISRLELGKPVVSTTIDVDQPHKVTIGSQGTLFNFRVPVSTESFVLKVDNCGVDPCNITLRYIPFDLASATSAVCDGSATDCQLHVPSPPLGDVNFVELSYHGPHTFQNVTFSVVVTECSPLPSPMSSQCLSLPALDRIQSMDIFTIMFGFLQFNMVSFSLNVVLAPIIIIPFEIIDPNDIGGSLRWQIQMLNHTRGNEAITVEICGALLYNYLPVTSDDFDVCTNISHSIQQMFDGSSESKSVQYVPYPRIGMWHVILQARCFDNDSSGVEQPCPPEIYLDMGLGTQACMDDSCSDKGTCMLSSAGSDLVTFSACKCDADYQGFACTDDTNAQSVAVQLAGAYLLTLSNLFFIPSIFISLKRRFLTEAFVYFYNMFFSTFYHACDGTRLDRYRLCIIKYDVLQAADYFSSACSLWFTLVAMARIRYRYVTPLLQIMGPFGIIIGIVYDRKSLCVIAVPIFCGLAAITGSWGHKMYQRKKLYPSWRRYLFFLLPGLVLATVGASVFAFLETASNYKYVHSVWHMCIALSILFLLPPRKYYDYDVKNSSSNTSSSHLLTDFPAEPPVQSQGEDNPAYIDPERG